MSSSNLYNRDNMENGREEQIAFGLMAKGQKKYGSTSIQSRKDSTSGGGFEYSVKRGDTLQGLAIKFGTSTEQIRRANQLWTNDSLFLRNKLLIPCEAGNQMCNGTTNGRTEMLRPSGATSQRSEDDDESPI